LVWSHFFSTAFSMWAEVMRCLKPSLKPKQQSKSPQSKKLLLCHVNRD
jgi:hypothetical protein